MRKTGQTILLKGNFICTRMDFTKKTEMSLDFAEIKNIESMSMGMTYRTH